MKKIISLFMSVVLLLCVSLPALAADDKQADAQTYAIPKDVAGSVVILHSNDVHGAIEGYAKMAALKIMYQEAGAQVFMMDAGDFSQGNASVSTSKGASAVELMGLAGGRLPPLQRAFDNRRNAASGRTLCAPTNPNFQGHAPWKFGHYLWGSRHTPVC